MKILRLLFILIVLLSTFALIGQPGTLRTDFGINGITTIDLTNEDEIQDIALLSDGSFIACGYIYNNTYDGIIMRISATGEVIWSKEVELGSSPSTNDFQSVVVKDDEIFVQGNHFNPATSKVDIVILKYDKDGNQINEFGVNGRAIATMGNGLLGFEMTSDADGNLFVIGRTYYFSNSLEDGVVVKFNSNGELDNSFGSDGISQIGVGSFRTGLLEATIINDEIYAVGWFHNTADVFAINENGVIFKLKADGSLDQDFGNNGLITFDVSSSDVIDDIEAHGPEHFIIGASGGTSQDDIYVLRYDLMGDLDLNFGTNGRVRLDYGDDDDVAEILVRDDLGIFICATLEDEEDFAIISMDASGNVYSTFGDNGKFILDIEDNDNISEGIILPNGDVLLGGESNEGDDGDFAFVRVEGYPTCTDVETEQSISDCESVSFDGQVYTESGTYDLVYESNLGCDSIIHLKVIIENNSEETLDLTTCDAISINGETYSNTGTYNQTLTASNGCDSILTIQLVILQPSEETLNISECHPISINETLYSDSGTYTQMLTANNGCDSILTLNVNIENLESSIMEDENGTLVSEVEAAQYQWYNCTAESIISGAESNTFDPMESGDYALIINSEMCSDTSKCITAMLSGTHEASDLNSFRLYPNPAQSEVYISGMEKHAIANISLYNLSGIKIQASKIKLNDGIGIGVDHLESGLYYIKVLSKAGYESVLPFVKD